MKKHKSSEKAQETDQSDESPAEIFSGLLTAVADEESEKIKKETDPFNSYVQKMRAKFHTNFPLFSSRFIQGYHTIVEELRLESQGK